MSIFNLSEDLDPGVGAVLNTKSAVIPSSVASFVTACTTAASAPCLSSTSSALEINLICPIKSPSCNLASLSLVVLNITSLPVAAPEVL